jgi:hypothetical protein
MISTMSLSPTCWTAAAASRSRPLPRRKSNAASTRLATMEAVRRSSAAYSPNALPSHVDSATLRNSRRTRRPPQCRPVWATPSKRDSLKASTAAPSLAWSTIACRRPSPLLEFAAIRLRRGLPSWARGRARSAACFCAGTVVLARASCPPSARPAPGVGLRRGPRRRVHALVARREESGWLAACAACGGPNPS